MGRKPFFAGLICLILTLSNCTVKKGPSKSSDEASSESATSESAQIDASEQDASKGARGSVDPGIGEDGQPLESPTPEEILSINFTPKTTGENNIHSFTHKDTTMVMIKDRKNHLYASSDMRNWIHLIDQYVEIFQVVSVEDYIYIFTVIDNRVKICRFQTLEVGACQLEVHSTGLVAPGGQNDYGIESFDVILPQVDDQPMPLIQLAVALGKPKLYADGIFGIIGVVVAVDALVNEFEGGGSSPYVAPAPNATPGPPKADMPVFASVIPIPSTEDQFSNINNFKSTLHNGVLGEWKNFDIYRPQADTDGELWLTSAAIPKQVQLSFLPLEDSTLGIDEPYSKATVVLYVIYEKDNETKLYRYWRYIDQNNWQPFVTNNPFLANTKDDSPLQSFYPHRLYLSTHQNGCSTGVLLHKESHGTSFPVAAAHAFGFQPKDRLPCERRNLSSTLGMYKYSSPQFEIVGQIERSPPDLIKTYLNHLGDLFYFTIVQDQIEYKIFSSLPVLSNDSGGMAGNLLGQPFEDLDIVGRGGIQGLKATDFSILLFDTPDEPIKFVIYMLGFLEGEALPSLCYADESTLECHSVILQ